MKSTIEKPGGNGYNGHDETGLEDVNMSADDPVERLLTVQEISQLLKVPRSYVYWLTHQRRIPHLKIHGHLRFRQSHIEEWLKSQEVCHVHIQEEVRD
jgi:excisionase family DNA binding protein